MAEAENSADYIWHFKLCDDDAHRTEGDDALAEMVREQISALLRCVQLTSDGRGLRITGFRFLDDPGREHPIASPFADAAPDDQND